MRKKPMKTILGYTINDTLYEGSQFVVYRGFSEGGKPVVLKVLRKEYPTTIEVARFQREFEIISEFHVEGVIQVFGIEHYKHTLVMVMEDFGGESLARLKERGSLQLNIFEFLNLAIQITNILDEIHRLEVIHKDINPANIIWNLETGQLKIIDFGDSTLLSEETVAYANPNLLNGTLPYISPEQTGRMNRLVDYRTDFYSLGVTLYELLTSQRPFISQDPLEVVYAHIAKMPVAPHQYSPEIPLTISDIVVKLMEKNAEDRYQSIYGLQYDLQECLTQFSQAGKVDKFRIGKKDYFEKFLIPQKLYGRQREIKTLLSAFERVSKGSTEMMLVAGYSGVGKSSLVSELHKPIVEKRGYFISGKFDQYKRNIPYAPFIEAFQNLTQQLLTETEDQIAEWKSLILAAVGHNGRVIIDLIPDVELIIGKQPLISELSPTESQNRFNYIFQNFVRVFASSDHPLTIFLDDLQWVDLSSLGLIELLLSGDQTKFLLLIGAYRDNEVEASHPLMISLDKLTRQNCLFSTLPLTPLDERDLTQFVADIIHEKPISARPLSQLCRQKTNGNPFFLKQFINTLYQQKLLKFDPDLKAWSWNLDAIKKENFSDNVVTLMVGKINDLPTNTRIALKIAAAIGMRFDLKLMSLLLEKPSRQVAVDLWEAIQAGYITSIDDKYKYSQIDTDIKGFAADAELQFTHDRIQQAAYSFNDEEQKPRIHLRIGMFLIETLSQEEQGDQIFDIVNHFNKGIELLTESQTKIEAARLNQIAGYRAISAMAGSAAAQYFQTGLHLLEEDCWEQHYSLTFELTCGLIESSYLLASYEKAEELCDTTLHQAQNQLDTVRIYDLMCYNFTLQNRMGQTLTTGLEALKILNISLVEHPPENIDIDRLRNLDQMVEPDKLAAMSILVKIISCALVTQSPLMMPLIYTMVNLSSRYGNSSKAPFGYVWFGCTLCWTRKDIGLGYQLGRLAMDVMEKFDARDVETTVRHQFNSFIRHWCEHERHSLNEFPHIVQIGKETGDVEYGTYVAVNYIANLLLVGEPLASAREKQQPFIDWVASTKFSFSETYGNIFAQAAQCLMGQGDSAWRLQGDFLDENKMIPEMKRTNNNLNLFAVYSAKVITAYFNGSFSETVDFARQTELYEASIGGLLPVTQVPFYGALALLRTISDGDCEWNDAIKTLENYEEKLNLWAEHGPMNFQHKYDLVKAEKARVSGRIIEAEAYYEQAVKGASENEYIHEEALAYELASEFYYNRGMMKFSQTYMREAHNCYRIWGANGKVKDLEERFPDFLSDMPTLKEASSEKNRRSSSSTGGNLSQLLDVSSLIKATRSLSAEVVLEELLKKMMHIMFENTGAQKGLLIMPHENEFIIEAEGSDDLNEINVLQPVRLAVKSSARQPASIIRYVARTRKTLMLDDAGSLGIFKDDPYILNNATKSILCAPIVHQNKLTGIIYLENNLATGVFTSDRLDIINILSAQAAISIENARLYATLEDKIAKRTEELQKAHDELEQRVEERTLELKEKQARLVHTSRLTALGELAAGVAHELGQPLQVIKSVSGLVHDEIKADTFNQKEILQFVNNLSNEVDRAAAIINNMRAFAGFGENNTEITSFIDIHISLMGSLAFFRAQFKKHQIELNLEIDDNLPKIQADSHKIQQVVVNLLSNARYAVDNKKPTAGGDKKKEVTIRLRQSIGKDQLVLEVKDNGIGMGEEEIHHCLEPFYTTKKPGEGTGLGLSITYGLVKEHGFKLEIESKRGEYSLFRIIMPINSRE